MCRERWQKCDVGSALSVSQAVDLSQARDEAAKDTAYERLWKSREAQHLGPKENLPWPSLGEQDACPFPGLLAFDEKYAPAYFGRELERDQVVADLKRMRDQGVPRLLMIVGRQRERAVLDSLSYVIFLRRSWTETLPRASAARRNRARARRV